ncbi:MAG: hypothetical protein HQK49_13815 [Oligoflexia bacterium]|nr:hypothetical protein [Oligoflexia bacterium]
MEIKNNQWIINNRKVSFCKNKLIASFNSSGIINDCNISATLALQGMIQGVDSYPMFLDFVKTIRAEKESGTNKYDNDYIPNEIWLEASNKWDFETSKRKN